MCCENYDERIEMIRFLLSEGIDVNYLDKKDRMNVLHLLYNNYHIKDAKYLYVVTKMLAALLLECKVNGNVNLQELDEMNDDFAMKLTATEQEHAMINDALKDFAANASEYDIAEMMMEDELQEMAEGCEKLRKELYE